MKHAALATLALLSGCATDSAPPPAVEVHEVTRTVEVQRPCQVTIPQRPAPIAKPMPTDGVALAAELALKLAEYSGPGGFADRATAALKTCTKP